MRNEENKKDSIAVNKEDSSPVLAELSQAGFEIEWVSELYTKGLDYRKAIPILVRWLPIVENLDVKESIVRALSVPWSKGTTASRQLVEEFRKLGPELNLGLKWAISNALSIVADDSILNEIISLVKDESHGKAREMLVVALGNMKSHDAVDFLIELLKNEELAGYAIMALGKLKALKARSDIARFLVHPNAWIRRETKKALARIDKNPR